MVIVKSGLKTVNGGNEGAWCALHVMVGFLNESNGFNNTFIYSHRHTGVEKPAHAICP